MKLTIVGIGYICFVTGTCFAEMGNRVATKISFINEVANICEKVVADIRKVRLGIGSDNRIGYDFIYAGCGYGGSCFPKDIKSLIYLHYEPKILLNVNKVNEDQKGVLVNKIIDRFSSDLSGLTFSILGLSFKPKIYDVRSAPSIIINEIIKKGGKVNEYVPKAIYNFKKFLNSDSISFKNSRYDVLDSSNALILITKWKEFRSLSLEEISKRMKQKIIFDRINIYNSKIRKEGFELYQLVVNFR